MKSLVVSDLIYHAEIIPGQSSCKNFYPCSALVPKAERYYSLGIMKQTSILRRIILVAAFGLVTALAIPQVALAGKICGESGVDQAPVTTSIDLGCINKGNPIADMTFGIIKFLSAGVGIVVVASIIVGGIQYTTSAGDPQKTAAATKRIRESLIGLLVFIFAYAILNYVIPGAVLH